jgi:Raf kinase inhibitor-like YbhB/YbcL family protein
MSRGLIGAALVAAAVGVASAAPAADFTVTSDEVQDGKTISAEHVFAGFGCTGHNVSPSLHWKGAPAGTKSYAVTVYDPDAPTGSGWWHWVVYNIPPDTTDLPKGAGDPKAGTMPKGAVQSRTDFGAPGWGGPCPPPGDPPHHYLFTVHALDVDNMPLEDTSSPAMIGFNLHFHTLGKATLTGLYGR